MTMFVKVNNQWQEISKPQTQVGGSWQPVVTGWVNVSGTWKRFFPSIAVADILLVGGGGGGGGDAGQDEGGGGGGGGGVLVAQNIVFNAENTYTIVVGDGGTGGSSGAGSLDGGITTISGPDIQTITAYGGGGGGASQTGGSLYGNGNFGAPGASGGGGSGPGQYYPGGSAIYGAQGNAGAGGPHEGPGGGGGGYTGAGGADGTYYDGGPGGVIQSVLDTQSWSVGGGGGGGAWKYSGSDGGVGGVGGGGDGDGAPGYSTFPAASQGGGGGCFIGDALVTLASGTQIAIRDVKVGDFVFNYNRTSINQVKFIEIASDTDFNSLYSPTTEYEPFATINHPLYIAGLLSSPIREQANAWYPWLDITVTITPTQVQSSIGQPVYNLWVDGDGTYIINKFGTTSIIGDGGVIRLCVENGWFDSRRASELLFKFTQLDTNTTHGAYILNRFFGKLNINVFNQLLCWVYKDESNPIAQKIVNLIFKLTGFVASKIKRKL
jgi:hypothetical protein